MAKFDSPVDYSQKHPLPSKRSSSTLCLRLRLWRISLPAASMWGGSFVEGLFIMVAGRIKPNNQPKMIGGSGNMRKQECLHAACITRVLLANAVDAQIVGEQTCNNQGVIQC